MADIPSIHPCAFLAGMPGAACEGHPDEGVKEIPMKMRRSTYHFQFSFLTASDLINNIIDIPMKKKKCLMPLRNWSLT
jgi:hypothetical protein